MLFKIKRALLSVTDKSKLVEVATMLKKYDVEIISSGGTAKFLMDNGFSVTPIEEVTGNPEAFGGRMKTISFQIGSALLFRREHNEDIETSKKLNIRPIDLVVCNLYPFSQVVEKNGSYDELIENIDVGGPTMIRAAAKNHAHVVVLTDPNQYEEFVNCLSKNQGSTDLSLRKKMAVQAFERLAQYDSLVAKELASRNDHELITEIISPLVAKKLRYGENPHQKGFVINTDRGQGIAGAECLGGKELSYNNLLDADAAYRAMLDLNLLVNSNFPAAVSIIKHATPCGLSLGRAPLAALENAWECDPISSFGGIIAFNKSIDSDVAQFFKDKFVEVIIAPDFTKEALAFFETKKNVRLLKVNLATKLPGPIIRSICGGFVVQDEDNFLENEFKAVTKNNISKELLSQVPFGILCCKHLKSNGIALIQVTERGPRMIGAGMGNPNRLVSVFQAVEKAKENGVADLSQLLLISDAFFPFSDTVELSYKYGVRNIVQPGGSIKDKDVIETSDKLGVAMVMTGTRHFRH